MSLISLSPHAAGSFNQPAADRLSRAVFTTLHTMATAAVAIADYWHERRSVRRLADADEAVLRDLGIARSDIPRLVRKGRR